MFGFPQRFSIGTAIHRVSKQLKFFKPAESS